MTRTPDNSTTTDGKPPAAGYENASAPQPVESGGQHGAYWVLTPEERAKGFVRQVRRSYQHEMCGGITTMGVAIAETYARDVGYYGSTFCCACRAHFPVGESGQFVWVDGHGRATADKVGT